MSTILDRRVVPNWAADIKDEWEIEDFQQFCEEVLGYDSDHFELRDSADGTKREYTDAGIHMARIIWDFAFESGYDAGGSGEYARGFEAGKKINSRYIPEVQFPERWKE